MPLENRVQHPWERQRPEETIINRQPAQVLPTSELVLPVIAPNLQLLPARIDVPEELTLNSGETGVWSFFYHPGVPFASAFGLVWYATEDDREDRVDPLVVDMPRHIFYPTNPVARLPEEFEHEGYIEIEAPVVETDTTFFGEATIFQN